jgi:hypothetical protein
LNCYCYSFHPKPAVSVFLNGVVYDVGVISIILLQQPAMTWIRFRGEGDLSIPDEDGQRTDFVFTNTVIDLGKWGKYSLPPLGKGWFDTIYLDEDLRVDVNSRDDILICTPSKTATL